MSICPFMTKSFDSKDQVPCITTCELRVGDYCTFKILGTKALKELKAQKSNSNTADSSAKLD